MANHLSIIQKQVKAPKGQFNSFGKYPYRSAEDIVEAVKPIINPLGFSLILSDEIVNLGNRFYVKATATITNNTETHFAVGYAREEETKKGMDGSQVTGSSSSYARKYALNGLFALDDTKDSDATNTHGREPEAKQAPKPSVSISEADLKELKFQLDGCADLIRLKEIWNSIEPQYQVLPIVKELVTNRKSELS
jgi:hypothetical protein